MSEEKIVFKEGVELDNGIEPTAEEIAAAEKAVSEGEEE